MRLALVFMVLVSFGAVAGPNKARTTGGKPGQWKCSWRGSVVSCERIDRMPGSAAKDSVFLYERTAPEFGSLVVAPASFESFPER